MSYETGTLIGDYEIVDVLGTGGMGKVYKVRNTISDRIEAMKILLPNLDADQELAQRFLREIKVQASLHHPNIASLRTAQRVENQLLMIMEYVEGSTIEKVMRERRIALPDCVGYATQVLSALGYAHAHGVVHRDIKPPNIMLTPEGVIKLMDFGIAKISVDHRLTQTGRTVGSLFYMSPEQIRGNDVDGRSDVYSFGIMLYEMVTGRRPFEGESDYTIMAAHLQQAPQPPMYFDQSLPQVLNDVILMSIAKDPGQRFQTADAFRLALESVGKRIGVAPSTSEVATQVFPRPAAFPAPPSPPSGSRRTPTVVEALGSQPPPGMPLPQLPSHPQLQSLPQLPQASFQPPPQPPFQPQFQPQFQPPAYNMPLPQTPRGNRGLYMVIGSVVTIGILAAAAFYVPKLLRAHASAEPTQVTQSQPPGESVAPPPSTPTQPAPTQPEPTQTVPTPSAPAQPEPTKPEPTKPAPVQQAPTHEPVGRPPAHREPVSAPPPPIQQTPPPVVQTPPVEPVPQPNPGNPPGNPAIGQSEELSRRMVFLRSRIDHVNAGVARSEEQQRRMGNRRNEDLVASQRRMMYFMETADTAMRKGNLEQARTALNNAGRELDKLEERVGR